MYVAIWFADTIMEKYETNLIHFTAGELQKEASQSCILNNS